MPPSEQNNNRSGTEVSDLPSFEQNKPRVYLALTAPDLERFRDMIATELTDWGFLVMPASLPIGNAAFRTRVMRDIQHCILSVHLVGSQKGLTLSDEQRSIVAVQYECAQAAALHRIVWIQPGREPDPEVKEALARGSQADVEYLENRNIEYLKEEIEAALTRLQPDPPDAKSAVLDRIESRQTFIGSQANSSSRGTTGSSTATSTRTRVFISHSSLDRAFVEEELIPFLREHNIVPWYSAEEIEMASEWERSIAEGLKGCDWFLVVLTPRSVSSKWVRREVFWAMERREGRIIPLLIETCEFEELHLGLLPLQYIDFRQNPSLARAELLRGLRVL